MRLFQRFEALAEMWTMRASNMWFEDEADPPGPGAVVIYATYEIVEVGTDES